MQPGTRCRQLQCHRVLMVKNTTRPLYKDVHGMMLITFRQCTIIHIIFHINLEYVKIFLCCLPNHYNYNSTVTRYSQQTVTVPHATRHSQQTVACFILVVAGFTTVKNLIHCILSDYSADKYTDLIFANSYITPGLAADRLEEALSFSLFCFSLKQIC